MRKADLSKKPEVLKTVDTFLAAVPWTPNRTVIIYLREHGGRRYVRLRTFNKHRKKGCWYPAPRFYMVPLECAAELGEDGYQTIGAKAEASRVDRLNVVGELLPDGPPDFTVGDVRDGWPEGSIPRPGKRTVQQDLKHGAETGRWTCGGTGTKGSPYRYWQLDSIRAGSPS